MTDKTPWVVLVAGEPTRAVCERCGGEYTLKLPMEIWELASLSEGFTKKHADCKVSPEGLHCVTCLKTGHAAEGCPNLFARTPAEWRAGPDVGVSSCTIYGAIMGYGYLQGDGIPYDRGDFGRCSRLLRLFPAWQTRLTEVAVKHPPWSPFVRDWIELEGLYVAERWDEFRQKIRRLVDESRSIR